MMVKIYKVNKESDSKGIHLVNRGFSRLHYQDS